VCIQSVVCSEARCRRLPVLFMRDSSSASLGELNSKLARDMERSTILLDHFTMYRKKGLE
jgi:hypothetical protein